ncbi:MAG TPA: beta-propeller fold lactonase family protein [Terracidiphilus sp.]|nr:beta-propeller fold lactonase family protein [Terracidiphilus sp.]
MKLMKFGKTLLMIAISAGIILGVTSCVQSYTVGYLYVTGTNNAAASNNGIISGFKIDHNRGSLTAINGLPVSSGGANPGRAVLLTGGNFLYVLNRGKNSTGTPNCTQADPCSGANITVFAIGGNGVLSPQETFFTQGINPIRLIADASGTHLYVLDEIAPDPTSCALALGTGVTSCGDITGFTIDQTTGRLTLILNAQVTSASGAPLPYFPIPANPIDFVLSSSYVISLTGNATTGDSVFPYTYSSVNGQLTVNQNSAQPLNIGQATAIVAAGGYVYVLDNEGTLVSNGATSQILPFTVGTNGALQQQTGGAVPDDVTESNPVYLVLESKGKWVYLVNQGNNNNNTNAQSGITGYVLDPTTHQLSEISGSPWGSGAGPQCMLEDPSSQFIYTANFNDSTVTGRVVDQNSGVLDNLPGNANKSYPLSGPAAWCVVTGRTS